jgi:hypothetical protein
MQCPMQSRAPAAAPRLRFRPRQCGSTAKNAMKCNAMQCFSHAFQQVFVISNNCQNSRKPAGINTALPRHPASPMQHFERLYATCRVATASKLNSAFLPPPPSRSFPKKSQISRISGTFPASEFFSSHNTRSHRSFAIIMALAPTSHAGYRRTNHVPFLRRRVVTGYGRDIANRRTPRGGCPPLTRLAASYEMAFPGKAE